MTKAYDKALQAVSTMNQLPIYVIIPNDDGTSSIVCRDPKGFTERRYEGLDPLKACKLADALNEAVPFEYGQK